MRIPNFYRSLAVLGLLGTTSLAALGQANPKNIKPKKTPTPPPFAVANPVLAGDYPDPSVTKIGDTYWASATSSNWGGIFPLLKSTNLTEWVLVGHVFPTERPTWADYYFWAPEISQENGKVYIYYTAHKRGGNLCVAVASADRPEGPYTDHGPLVGQPDGSIDGFPMKDENGQMYLIWKEDGNSVQKPTPIWAQKLNADRTALIGEKTELMRNTAAWEGSLIEGPSVIRHDGYFYLFYAANGCCGHVCTYGTGVARSKNLLGPWEKYANNPVLTKNDIWACPGHGTVLQKGDRWFLLHHAYKTDSFENVGRQGVLSEFTWTKEGWPQFLRHSPATVAAKIPGRVEDEFTNPALGPAWQWPVEDKPTFAVRDGHLLLTARPDNGGAALGRSALAANYTATTTLLAPKALPPGTAAGLAALGDPNNSLSLNVVDGKIQLWERRAGKVQVLAENALPPSAAAAVQLRMQTRGANQYSFAWSADGRTWTNMLPNNEVIKGEFLPPWDRGVRVGMVAQGAAPGTASFERFVIQNQ